MDAIPKSALALFFLCLLRQWDGGRILLLEGNALPCLIFQAQKGSDGGAARMGAIFRC